MKRASLVPAFLWLSVSLLIPPVATAQVEVGQDDDPYQRRIVFHNELPEGVTIYPVIAAPQGDNCNSPAFPSGTALRILVNDGQAGGGIQSKGSVTVKLPKEQPCPPKGGFYGAVRVFVLLANVQEFEKGVDANQKTQPITDAWTKDICAACTVGTAKADYGLDAPGQLLEYTILSQVGAAASPISQNDPNGIPLIDFDVSYVDDVFLPIAMALGDDGATQYMGSSLPFAKLPDTISTFLATGTGWSKYAAYSDHNFPHSVLKDLFVHLAVRPSKVPSGYQLIANVGGFSSLYLPSNDDSSYTRECVDPDSTHNPAHNLMCALPPPVGAGLKGKCCPNENNAMLGCCDQDKFMVDKTSRLFNKALTPPGFETFNATFENLVSRWTQWQGAASRACNGEQGKDTPVLDKAGFCADFKKTVDFIWQEFAAHSTLEPRKDKPDSPLCGQFIRSPNKMNHCIVANIIGYTNVVSDFNADNCKKCPNPDTGICPNSCTVEALRNEVVQALLRSVPWTPAGDPAKCGGCPSTDSSVCPLFACVTPAERNPAARLYHRNKFLHFWAPSESPYNLNPYARFVHKDGAAPGAYSFSIDDFYGNFGGRGSTLIIDVGGIAHVPNREPFDPFKQYSAGVGEGWHHAEVCGRTYSLPKGTPAKTGLSAPVSFWSKSLPQPECVIRLFLPVDPNDPFGPSRTDYVEYKLAEVTYSVTDDQTGATQTVQGLSGVFVNRFPTDSPPRDPWCDAHSTVPNDLREKFCRGNISGGVLNKEYVSVSNDPCMGLKPTDSKYFTCGKPLVNLNVPSPK
jgi:hypothetical protein